MHDRATGKIQGRKLSAQRRVVGPLHRVPLLAPRGGHGVGHLDEILGVDVCCLLARDRGEQGLAVLDQALGRVLLTGDLLLHQDGLLPRVLVQLRD